MQQDSAEAIDNKSIENENTLYSKQKTEQLFASPEMLHHNPKGCENPRLENPAQEK